MVRKGETAIKGAADLAGRQVCTVTGAKSADLLPTVQPKAKLIKFGTYSNCAQALKEKRVDAVVTGEAILLGIVIQNPGDFEMVDGYLAGEENAIGFPKDDAALHDYLNAFLLGSRRALYENGRQSISIALLDAVSSGVVLTAIQDRQYARIYVKELVRGESDVELSPEERKAVELAAQ